MATAEALDIHGSLISDVIGAPTAYVGGTREPRAERLPARGSSRPVTTSVVHGRVSLFRRVSRGRFVSAKSKSRAAPRDFTPPALPQTRAWSVSAARDRQAFSL